MSDIYTKKMHIYVNDTCFQKLNYNNNNNWATRKHKVALDSNSVFIYRIIWIWLLGTVHEILEMDHQNY